ncbi:hypothetical protein ASPSYDRAFT_94353 [Aspergillus sydowii CBS 593.65]|uniref:Uncharacterized protein n=1 Tax=Aspergillus sydowii CBS 593.65 TaxID=1036612 RepID=A0A1L9T349_9EURO|nr:uncharacterized protein ASPSYDRAFT_94353 [Aspergillus sydowii CBS 593.65]OJJ53856.1 hypothetical protein ASPSYDRAFT_94353 [Aspergillus sydowii CBS 593.65]
MAPPLYAIFVGGGFITGAGPCNRWPNKVTKARMAKEEKKGRKEKKDRKDKKEDGGGAHRGKKDTNAMSFDELKKEDQRLQTAIQVEVEGIATKACACVY